MGHIIHHAIVVTSWDDVAMRDALHEALRIGLAVTPITESPVNGYSTFCVVPDGSKSGWIDSDKGDVQRAKFIRWLRSRVYPDGSSSIAWVEVSYSADDRAAYVTQSQWSKDGAQ